LTTVRIGLEVSVFLSFRQNPGQNNGIKISNRWFENVAQLKYLGMTVTNQNVILEEIKGRLSSGIAFYYSVQNPLSSRLLLSRNVKIRIYKTIFLLVVVYEWF
jgi:heme A synthase